MSRKYHWVVGIVCMLALTLGEPGLVPVHSGAKP